MSKILVANLSAPELGYLSAELARRGELLAYVRRYANQDRWWERAVARLAVRRTHEQSIGRRKLPDGLESKYIVEAGVLYDFAAALVGRAGTLGVPMSMTRVFGMRLHHLAAARIARTAEQLAHGAHTVIAGAGMAEPAFRRLRLEGGGRAILNFSSAHHRVQRRVFEEQRLGLAEFAGLAEENEDSPRPLQEQYDREIDLADLILTGSSFAMTSFMAEGIPREKLGVVPYGADLRRFNAQGRNPDPRRFEVLYVGRLSFRKGIGHLLKAYARFRKPNTHLTLIGSVVGNRSCLRHYEEQFAHIPHVPQADLPRWYRQADVFVLPSLSEGMGMVAVEAMACGCPVIVSNHGPSEVVRDGVDGLVVPAGNVEAIRAALERLYADPELRQRMSQAAQEQAARYSWGRYAATAARLVLGGPDPVEEAA